MPYDMTASPQWKICVVTTSAAAGEYKSIKNSLLYTDHIYWVSLEVALKLLEHLMDRLGEAFADPGHFKEITIRWVPPEAPGAYIKFKEHLQSGGATAMMTQHFDHEESLQRILALIEGVKNRAERSPVLPEILRQTVINALTDSRVVVGETRYFGLGQSQAWNAYLGAHELMMSLSRLLLPDVSDLPVEVIMELRNRLQDSLDPVRAELLRLTEDLREIVSTTRNPGSISTEADNLIATRVEPLVRDASRRANELLDRKWRKLLTGAAKAFGFAGAGFADPKLFAKAIQQTLETGALALAGVEEDHANLKATSQFVLHARRLAIPHRN